VGERNRARAAFYQLEAEASGESNRAAAALYAYEIGELHETAGEEAAAIKAYAKALAADPTLKPVLWAIRRLFVRRKLWPDLIHVVEGEIGLAKSEGEKADLHVEKGQVLADEMGQIDEARAAFERAVELDPNCLDAWVALSEHELAHPAKVEDEAARRAR